MKLGVITTWKCNLKCKHCIYECPKNEDLGYKEFEKVFLKLIPFKLDYVSFSGGEAILNPDFPKMIEIVYKNNIYFKITSNALWYEKYLPLIQKYRNRFLAFHFSLDGLKETHDKIRTKGSFDKVIEAIVYYKMLELKIIVNLILNHYNFTEFEKLIQLCSDLKIYGVKVGAIVPTRTNKKYQVSFEERKKIFNNLKNWSEKYNIRLVNTSSLVISEEIKFCPNLYSMDLNLNQRGELTFCCNLPGSFGKLGDIDEEIVNILENKSTIGQKMERDRVKNLKELKTLGKTCNYCQEFFKII